MASNKLTDLFLRTLKNPDKRKYSDGEGLYILIQPSGSKLWQMTYRFEGKQKTLSFGPYPLISLKEARDKRSEAKKLLLNGTDLGKLKKEDIEKDENTFEKVFYEWFEKFYLSRDADTQKRLKSYFTNYVFPFIGNRPIKSIKPKEVWSCVEKMEKKGIVESAHRVLNYCGQVFRYATAQGYAERDVTTDLKGLLSPSEKKHYATIIEPQKVGELLRAIDTYQGSKPIACALKLTPLFFVRPGELRKAEWSQFDFDRKEWHVPKENMKVKTEKHIVPLATQAIEILNELKKYTGNYKFLFPSIRTNLRPMSDNTVNAALRRLGYDKEEITGHGFRAMATTLLNEMGYNRDWIERQLSHAERNKIRAAYNYAEFLPERRKIMQEWADYLEKLKAG